MIKNNVRKKLFGNVFLENYILFLLIIYILSISFTGPFFDKLNLTDIGGFLQIHHIFSLLFLPAIFAKRKIYLPNKYILIYAGVLFTVTFLNIFKWGISIMLFKYVYVLYILIVIITTCRDISLDKLKLAVFIAAKIILIASIVNIIFSYKAILIFIAKPYGHPLIDSLVGGGVNLEATFIAVFSVIFLSEKKYFYWGLSFIISIIFASRTGILLNIIALLIYMYSNKKHMKIKNIITILSIFIIALIILNQAGALEFILSRFMNIGNESGSLGRISLWTYAIDLVKKFPLGIGAGNGMVAITHYSGIIFREDNLHNVYLSTLVESGIIGFVAYISIVIGFLIKENRNRFNLIFSQIILLFLLSNMFQSAGAEPIQFLFIGLFLCCSKERKSKGDLQ